MGKQELIKRTQKLSCLLANKYGLKRVYLFGSLAEGLFLKGSDVDIAIEGMSFRDYLKALAEYRDINGVRLDILHLELCKPQLKEMILKEGKVLYEKK